MKHNIYDVGMAKSLIQRVLLASGLASSRTISLAFWAAPSSPTFRTESILLETVRGIQLTPYSRSQGRNLRPKARPT